MQRGPKFIFRRSRKRLVGTLLILTGFLLVAWVLPGWVVVFFTGLLLLVLGCHILDCR